MSTINDRWLGDKLAFGIADDAKLTAVPARGGLYAVRDVMRANAKDRHQATVQRVDVHA